MLRRKAYDQLMEWKSRDHKCLVVKGQRQVGKTYIIEKFGRDNYEHVVSFDLSENRDLRTAFDGNLDVDAVIRNLMMYHDPDDFVPGSTLIFLDELQECPSARTALKFFSIDGRYDVIASGPLLGVGISRDDAVEPLAPTGYEEHMTMRSLDFEEFLWACRIPQDVIDHVKGCISGKRPIDAPVLERMSSLFRDFMIVGGMPEAVTAFLGSKNYAEPSEVQKRILDTIEKDINRYNKGVEKDKNLECFLSIPAQLSDSNKKFTYSRIGGEGSRKAEDTYRENLLWIKGAGIGSFCYALRSVEPPLAMHEARNMFKVYMSDTGLLMSMCGQTAVRAIAKGDARCNMGAVAENEVCECIMKSGLIPRYYRKQSGEMMMDLDFVIELGCELAVIEVKSGKSRKAPSIGKAAKFFPVDRRIMLEHSNISVSEDGIEHYPMFAAAFLKDMESPPENKES